MSQVSIIDIEGNHPEIPTRFDANVGFAIPIANVLEIHSAVVAAGTVPTQTIGSGNTITTNIQIAQAIASTNASNIGLSAFNSNQFSVDANGFVSLAGQGLAIDSIAVQTGTSPVTPDANGLITINGSVAAAGTNPVRSNGTGVNTLALQVQISQAIASTNASNIGLAAFNSAHFSVDANGFVSLTGGGQAIDSFTTDVSGPIAPDAAGNVAFTGATNIFSDGSVANTMRLNLQGTNHALFIGRGATTASAQLTVGTNGQVIIGATGADPAFATLTSSDSSISFTIGANTLSLQVAGGTTVGKTITGNSGGALSPTAGNWNILGASTAAGTTPVQTVGSGSTLTVQVQKAQAIASTNATNVGLAAFNSTQFSVDANGFVSSLGPTIDLHTAKFIVGDTSNGANFSTIATAITAASSGDTIFIQTGTYTENLTLKAGVNLSAFNCDGLTGISAVTANVTIIGKLTANYSGVVSISGIKLQTNSDNLITITNASSTLNLTNCFLNVTNNTAIACSVSGSLHMYNCNGDLATTGIAYFALTAGALFIFQGIYTNSGASVTASTVSGGLADLLYTVFSNPITTSSSGTMNSHYTLFEGVGNTTILTLNGNGSGGVIDFCGFNSGSASAISVGSGVVAMIKNCDIISSNTNAITGVGTIQYGLLTFLGTSANINTTTQSQFYTEEGKYVATGQPSFSAIGAGAATVTGDGTVYTIGSTGTAWTEVYDRGGNFNTNGTFTAPTTNGQTNIYHFVASIGLTGINATNTGVVPQIVTSNRSYTGFTIAPFPVSVGGALVLNFSCYADMEVGDTAVLQVAVFGAGKNVSVSTISTNTFFQGTLIG